MKRLVSVAVIAAAAAMVGCDKNKGKVSDVPPAPETTRMEPVTVTETTVAPAPAAPAPAAPAVGGTKYTVKRGETLWGIATKHYGDGKRFHDIVAANPGLTPETLKAGQTIILP